MAKPFTSILCGVEGNPTNTEAVRQAIILAAPGAALHFMAVDASFEMGADSRRDVLEQSLQGATQLAKEAGISASSELREGRYAVDVLLPESENHDLLVIGTRGNSRVAGMIFGSTASEATHGTGRPLLIARKPPGPSEFASTILFASDGASGSWAPARTAAEIAAAFDSRLEVVHVVDGTDPERKRAVEGQIAEIRAATGEEPELSEPAGNATQAIIKTAEEKGSSLVVCGRRGLQGVRALGSVSERVGHGAPCSILLVPQDEDEEADS